MTEIKICGIKYDEDIGIINELKPDYAGMVLFFEKSKRNIAIDRAAEMIKKLDKNIQKIAVVVSPDINQIKAITDVGFDYIQIHKDMPDDILEKITIPVIRAVNMPDEINGAETESNFNDEIEKLIKNDKIYGILFDAGVPGSRCPAREWSNAAPCCAGKRKNFPMAPHKWHKRKNKIQRKKIFSCRRA